MPQLTGLDRTHLRNAVNSNRLGDLLADIIDAGDDAGTIPHATLVMSSQPTAADTVTIGDDVYEFQNAGGDLAADTNIGVVIGMSAAATRDNLVNAVNARDADNQHPNLKQTDSTTPALANGTERVRAIAVGTNMRIEPTSKTPGEPRSYPSTPDILLAESITAAADVWVEGNVNLDTLGGRVEAERMRSFTAMTVTAAMIAAGSRVIRVPFTPTRFRVQVQTAGGARRGNGSDTFAIVSDGISVTFGGGASPDIQATDIIHLDIHE